MAEMTILRPKRYINLETGLVRSFLRLPKRGKWKLTTLRYATPRGRRALEGDGGPR